MKMAMKADDCKDSEFETLITDGPGKSARLSQFGVYGGPHASWRRSRRRLCAGRPAPPIGRTYLKACPQASQPPDHDGRDVGNCAHHCGDHG